MTLRQELRRYNAEMAVREAVDTALLDGLRMTATVEHDDGRLTIERQPHLSEGTQAITESIPDAFGPDDRLTDGAREAIRRRISGYRRLVRRDNAIRKAGSTTPNAPPWATLVHPMAVAIMLHHGRDPLDLVRPLAWRTVRGFQTSANRGENAQGQLVFEGIMHGMHATLVKRMEDEPFGYIDRNGPVLVPLGITFPDTLLAAMHGRRVGEVLEGRAFEGLDVRIEGSIENSGGRQFIRLERRQVVIARAPEGVDTTWMDGRPPLAIVADGRIQEET